MILYANKRFGTKTFNHEFFPDQKPGVTDFKSIVLRNAGNDRDGLYMRDAICQRSMAEHTGIDWQAWQPAVVYINGKYHCILNIRERANEVNIASNYGLEDIDLTENGELKEGTSDFYDAFTAFYQEKGHTLEEYAKWIDWEEYLDIMAMNIYFCNLDFPGNNNVMWRPRTNDGRWRWIAKDVDYALGLYNHQATHNILKQYYNPTSPEYNSINFSITEESTLLFRNIMEDSDFRREFIDRTCIYMGDFLNEKGVRAVWDPMYEMITDEWDQHHDAVYGNPWWPVYDNDLRDARNWTTTTCAMPATGSASARQRCTSTSAPSIISARPSPSPSASRTVKLAPAASSSMASRSLVPTSTASSLPDAPSVSRATPTDCPSQAGASQRHRKAAPRPPVKSPAASSPSRCPPAPNWPSPPSPATPTASAPSRQLYPPSVQAVSTTSTDGSSAREAHRSTACLTASTS